MSLPILQAGWHGKLEAVESGSDSRMSFLSGHYYVKTSVDVDRRIDGALIIVGIPRET
jgi:hypothetical protein